MSSAREHRSRKSCREGSRSTAFARIFTHGGQRLLSQDGSSDPGTPHMCIARTVPEIRPASGLAILSGGLGSASDDGLAAGSLMIGFVNSQHLIGSDIQKSLLLAGGPADCQ